MNRFLIEWAGGTVGCAGLGAIIGGCIAGPLGAAAGAIIGGFSGFIFSAIFAYVHEEVRYEKESNKALKQQLAKGLRSVEQSRRVSQEPQVVQQQQLYRTPTRSTIASNSGSSQRQSQEPEELRESWITQQSQRKQKQSPKNIQPEVQAKPKLSNGNTSQTPFPSARPANISGPPSTPPPMPSWRSEKSGGGASVQRQPAKSALGGNTTPYAPPYTPPFAPPYAPPHAPRFTPPYWGLRFIAAFSSKKSPVQSSQSGSPTSLIRNGL